MIHWLWMIPAFAAGAACGVAVILSLFMDWVFLVTGFEEDLDQDDRRF